MEYKNNTMKKTRKRLDRELKSSLANVLLRKKKKRKPRPKKPRPYNPKDRRMTMRRNK